MTGAHAVTVLEAEVSFLPWERARPMLLSSGWIRDALEARVRVVIRSGTREAVGISSISVSDRWAWPGSEDVHESRQNAMCAFMRRLADDLPTICAGAAHPLELGLRLHDGAAALPATPDPPPLARTVCASPFDAAIHDAAGLAAGISAFDLYPTGVELPAADRLLGGGAGDAIRGLLGAPRPTLDAWWIVGHDDADDDLRTAADLGYRCFKLKLFGEAAADADFTRRVYETARRVGVTAPRLSVDYNGGAAGPDEVLRYVDALDSHGVAGAVAYVEQPTPAERIHGTDDYRQVASRIPVIADEGLSGLDVLPQILRQGWSGIALKTGKGQSTCLVAGAWAVRHGLRIAFQDLTNPGYAAIHAALFAARVATINGIELNSPQFTPAANQEWLPRLAGLFEPRDGRHHVPADVPGLGSTA